jgi:exopolyphosphatase/guanosine-5'-triphosphate,3'-diphosphate pyrophosphatase
VTRVGVVDLGTNSTRLLVADVEDSRVSELDRHLEITRLGEGVDARGQLLPQAIARVRNVLVDYRRTIEGLGAERTLAFATSAVRDAENGEAFLGEVEWSYGFATRLLSGHEEALLTFRGVAAGRELTVATLVIDVGGGSTELILGGPDGVSFHKSVDLGEESREAWRGLRSASPARSPSLPPSTSGSSARTPTSCTGTECPRRRSPVRSSSSPPCR